MEDIASIENIRMSVRKMSRGFMHEQGQQVFHTKRETNILVISFLDR